VPVLAPRDPAPLFSWEVYPHLYPQLTAPRSPAQQIPRIGLATLFALLLFFAGVAGLLAYEGAYSLAPSHYTIAGVVVANGTGPLAGTTVRITGENSFDESVLTNASGTFTFSGVPAGGMTLNATHPRLGFVAVQFFLTPLYQAVSGNPMQLVLTFNAPSSGASAATSIESPFPDLETFVSSLWAGAGIVAIAALVVGLGVRAVRRGRPPTLAVAGGIAAVLVPVAVTELGLTGVFPYSWLVSVVAVVLGIVTAVLFLLLMARTGPSPSA
jgi:hypothetical protein